VSRKWTTFAVDEGRLLVDWLAERLGEDEALVRASLALGAVWVDRVRVRENVVLRAGQRISVHEGGSSMRRDGWRVAFQDADLLVVDKASGVPVQAERGAAGALDEQVAERFVGARLLHRIDRDTSGLVMFTLRKQTRAAWQQRLEAGQIVREYLAVVDGAPAWDERILDRPIEGKPARTEVRIVRRAGTCALVAARLATGRTHQIRLHLEGAGHPILGDPLHAPEAARARAPRLALHATRLAWPGGEVVSPLPPDLDTLV
jgi:tRNA pseudouridine32 synthase/23S rRNA pseudouridine746 synthase